MVVEIPLSKTSKKYKGLYKAIVDDIDSDLAEYNWALDRKRYAIRTIGYKTRKHIMMHRLILERVLGRPLVKGEDVDHINNNGFDNRRENSHTFTECR